MDTTHLSPAPIELEVRNDYRCWQWSRLLTICFLYFFTKCHFKSWAKLSWLRCWCCCWRTVQDGNNTAMFWQTKKTLCFWGGVHTDGWRGVRGEVMGVGEGRDGGSIGCTKYEGLIPCSDGVTTSDLTESKATSSSSYKIQLQYLHLLNTFQKWLSLTSMCEDMWGYSTNTVIVQLVSA